MQLRAHFSGRPRSMKHEHESIALVSAVELIRNVDCVVRRDGGQRVVVSLDPDWPKNTVAISMQG
jgi:hypothetical protein